MRSEATIHATGRIDNATAAGTVTARKEGGSWKIGHESWNVSMRLDASAGAAPRRPDVERPNAEEYAKLRGQWKGSEVGGSNEWTRVQSYTTSTRDVRCFNLMKASDEPLSSTLAAAAPAPVDPAPASASVVPEEKGDPGVTGEASLLFDGVPMRYGLRTGFFYDTRFKNPKHATIQFQPERSGNLTSGLVITLDATQSGQRTTDGDGTQINWIADGGQVFPPRSTCAVRVTSPYSGSGTFRGEIDHCVVHSAGIEHTISSARFVMVGAPSR